MSMSSLAAQVQVRNGESESDVVKVGGFRQLQVKE